MKVISQITLPEGLVVDLLFQNGKLGYTFEHGGQNFGTSVRIENKSVIAIASACLLLYTNAHETYKELMKDKPLN